MIRISELDKYYNKGQANELHVLNRISLELPDKGMVAVFGRSGCGKTTLLNVCGGLDGFTGGSVNVNGADIRKGTDALRNREIGYIFQNYNLNQLENVQENVADALRLVGMKDEKEIRRRTETALAAVGMAKYRLRKPGTLSGGQQQRVAIARAIVKNPPVILADEPTGNLDEANTLQVMDMLRSLADEHLVVLVTHEAKLVDLYCDRVIELSDGQIKRIYDNEHVSGLDAAGRDEIWLGGMPKNETVWRYADVEYYGEAPEQPLHLIVVNQNGRFFLKVESPEVQVLDENSEIRLHEGAYEARPEAKQRSLLDLSELPQVKAGICGRLFHLKNSLKSGWDAISAKQKKKGNRLLRALMLMFAAIIVLMSASFGTSFRERAEAEASVAGDLYYMDIGGSRQLERIKQAARPENGFDSLYYLKGYGDMTQPPEFTLAPGHFITSAAMDSPLTLKAFPLNRDLLPEGITPLAGDVKAEGAILTRAAADELLSASTVGYIRNYRDLIGLELSGNRYREDGVTMKIAAVVEGKSKTFYTENLRIAEWLMNNDEDLPLYRVSALEGYEADLRPGHVTVLVYLPEQASGVKAGETVWIRGVELTVDRVINASESKKEPFYIPYDDGSDDVHYEPLGWYDVCYLLTDEDYARVMLSLGRTDKRVTTIPLYDLDSSQDPFQRWTAVLHAADTAAADKAAAALEEDGIAAITPSEAREAVMKEVRASTRSRLISLAVMLAIMCLCMYFIMRAGLMSRVKEVGIYRAIGVTKGNLIFRFLIEALVLCAVTVLTGFLAMSLLMRHWVTHSALMKILFHYPLWMMLLLFLLLVFLCAFCGVLPVMLLLRKTPSEILAKYDI